MTEFLPAPEFGTPPPQIRALTRNGRPIHPGHAAAAEQCRARPGEWARVCASNKRGGSLGTSVKRGKGAYAPAGAFDAVTRKDADGKVWLWVRYVGSPAGSSVDRSAEPPELIPGPPPADPGTPTPTDQQSPRRGDPYATDPTALCPDCQHGWMRHSGYGCQRNGCHCRRVVR